MRRSLTIASVLIFLAIGVCFASAAESQSPTVCCEKTKTGLYCQDVPAEQCEQGMRQVPTSCRATSYCKPGVCYDSKEGTCLDNTPQLVCNVNNGLWTDKPAPQCALGCCVLGDQAAFVSLVRCKKLSSALGLQTNYKTNIATEAACIASVYGQEKGACVYAFEFQKSCRVTTREDCVGKAGSGTNKSQGEFFVGKLCSAEDLGTICGPTTKTMCVPGKEEVYFVDTCGNPTNVYDASKVKDANYWNVIMDKSKACNPNAANANSPNCGNCNYLAGSFCRATSSGTAKATYGDNICADLNCHSTQNGKSYKHGESWCVNTDAGTIGGNLGEGTNAVGSGFFKHICINGEEVLEACADFRQHECIEDKIETSAGGFSQAACRVNRWQDCVAQSEGDDCLNTDKRDCVWAGSALSNSSGVLKLSSPSNRSGILRCVPKNAPGLKFWEGEEATSICSQQTTECEVTYELGLLHDKEKGKSTCVENCFCLDRSWREALATSCVALGDCGKKINWVGAYGANGDKFAIEKED